MDFVTTPAPGEYLSGDFNRGASRPLGDPIDLDVNVPLTWEEPHCRNLRF